MTSSALGTPSTRPGLTGPGLPRAEHHGSLTWRALMTLAMAFVLLATTGWTAVNRNGPSPGPLAAAEIAWEKASVAGRPLPSPDAEPEAVSAFFRSLSAEQRDRLAARHPLIVGNLDGVPVELRYRANRASLEDARAGERRRARSSELTENGRRLAQSRVEHFTSMLSGGRQILAFDPTGHGRAAEVFGDLRHAERVSVVVPGSDTELLTFQKAEDDDPHTAPVGMAKALQAEQHRMAPGVPTATVAWADYTAPLGFGVDAASVTMATDGAERLVDSVRALPGDAPVSLMCHSYGSVVCGVAAGELPRRVRDIAVAGSPGMRADTAGDLHTGARVWAMRNDDDWIADVPHMEFGGLGHGADPMAAAFGARRLSAAGATGHAGYSAPGTGSLVNLAAVGAGTLRSADCAATDPGCAARR